MIGTRYRYKNYINEYFYKGYPKTVQICKSNFESIYEFLNLNDVFIGCCGNTSFEALHAGLPIINIVQNHLQNRNAQVLQEKYGFPNLGFYYADAKVDFQGFHLLLRQALVNFGWPGGRLGS